MKRPDGWLIEEFVTDTGHLFEEGKLQSHEAGDGYYTGVFWFKFMDGKHTRRYTVATAPDWLFALYKEATDRQ